MANRDITSGPVVRKMATLDPKVIPVILRRYPDFKGKCYESHSQVSYMGHGFADVVKVDGAWRTVVYHPGGRYRCVGGVHKKYKDAIENASRLLTSYKVAA